MNWYMQTLPHGRDSVLRLVQVAAVGAVVEGAPGREALLFEVELIGEVDVGFAVQEVAEIQAWSFEVHGVDLKVAPVEGAIRVVVVDFAFAFRILGALDSKSNAAIGAELLACILLVGSERVALVLLRLIRVFGASSQADYDRELKMKPQGRLQAERVSRVNGYHEADESDANEES